MMSLTQFRTSFISRKRRLLQRLLLGFLMVAFVLVLVSLLVRARISETFPYYPAVTHRSSVLFDGKILFNHDDPEAFKEQYYDAVRSAQESIFIAAYSLTDPTFIKLLEEQRKRGVEIHIVAPKTKERELSYALTFTNIAVTYVGSGEADSSEDQELYELMHHKFMLVDSGTSTEQLLWGSANMTTLQFEYDPSFVLVTSNHELIQSFLGEFNLLLTQVSGTKKFRTGKFHPFLLQDDFPNGTLELWFGPGYLENSLKERMLRAIDESANSIEILGWRINDRDVVNAIRDAAARGVQVAILVDDYYLWDEQSAFRSDDIDRKNFRLMGDRYATALLEERGSLGSVLPVDFNSFLHHHVMLVDGNVMFVGTGNWTRGGFFANDESAIVTNLPEMVGPYQNSFDSLWETLVGDQLQYQRRGSVISFDDFSELRDLRVYRSPDDEDKLGTLCYQADAISGEVTLPDACLGTVVYLFASRQGTLVSSMVDVR